MSDTCLHYLIIYLYFMYERMMMMLLLFYNILNIKNTQNVCGIYNVVSRSKWKSIIIIIFWVFYLINVWHTLMRQENRLAWQTFFLSFCNFALPKSIQSPHVVVISTKHYPVLVKNFLQHLSIWFFEVNVPLNIWESCLDWGCYQD